MDKTKYLAAWIFYIHNVSRIIQGYLVDKHCLSFYVWCSTLIQLTHCQRAPLPNPTGVTNIDIPISTDNLDSCTI